jgi:hypothetical protein
LPAKFAQAWRLIIREQQSEVQNMIKKYRKKPVVIEAVRWTGENYEEIAKFMDYKDIDDTEGGAVLIIETLEGDFRASVGDWIIKGITNEFYPCKPDVFSKTYEEVH